MFKQGKKFKKDQRKHKSVVEKYNLNLISISQLNIVDNLKSKNYANINEGFSVEMNPVEQKNLEEKNKITTLEGLFNNNMGQYITLYRTYLKELASRQSSLNTTLKNKVVTYSGQYFYINNTGTIRQFTDESWKGKDNSCPDSTKSLSPTEFSKLSPGPPMTTGELCRSGGYNAKDADNGTTAWVDNLGYKHRYNDFINRHSTCPKESVTITGIQYNAIPQGNVYGSSDTCNTMSLDSPTYDKLVVLNQKMLANVTAMKGEVNKMASEDITIDKNIDKQKSILTKTYKDLLVEQKKLQKVKADIQQFRGGVEGQNLSVPSVQMHHAIWTILGGAFIATIIYNSK